MNPADSCRTTSCRDMIVTEVIQEPD